MFEGDALTGRAQSLDWLRDHLALLGAVIFGAALRAYQLPGQILVDDEWHAVRKVITSGYREIFTSFGAVDHTIPITLYYELATRTVGLSEWVIRTPFFIAGTLTILVVPLLLRRHVGRPACDVLGWLLALSPVLVFYGRFARPYAIVALCSSTAVLAFYAWWREHRTRDAVLYAALAVLTGYFTLVALPFVLGPFVFFLVAAWRQSAARRWSAVKRLFGLGLATAGPLLVLLLPPLLADSRAMAVKVRHGTLDLDTALQVLQVATGAETWWVAVVVVALAAVGCYRLCLEAPRFGVLLSTLIGLQVVAVAVASPKGVERIPVLCRYLISCIPILLLFTAIGMTWLVGLATPRKGWRAVVLAGACAALFIDGPIPEASYRPNNWTANLLKKHLENKPRPLLQLQRKLRRVPEFYETLSQHPPGSLLVVEAPSPYAIGRNHLPIYQHIHRQRTMVGFVSGLCGQQREGEVPWGTPGIELRNFVFLAEPDELIQRGVDYVIFHRRLQLETRRKPPRGRQPLDITPCVDRYRERFGPPAFSDQDVVVFEING